MESKWTFFCHQRLVILNFIIKVWKFLIVVIPGPRILHGVAVKYDFPGLKGGFDHSNDSNQFLKLIYCNQFFIRGNPLWILAVSEKKETLTAWVSRLAILIQSIYLVTVVCSGLMRGLNMLARKFITMIEGDGDLSSRRQVVKLFFRTKSLVIFTACAQATAAASSMTSKNAVHTSFFDLASRYIL